jgi:GNAT superfamily N-acetyltransferase
MFRIETEVDRQRRTLLGEMLDRSNAELSPAMRSLRGTGHEDEVPLELWAVADDGTDALVGGLTGRTWARWLHVDLLWVAPTQRGSGLGARLLHLAEAMAHERGCGWSRLETWDFQAPDFYRGRGYEVVGRVDDYPPGATEYILTKRLDGAP